MRSIHSSGNDLNPFCPLYPTIAKYQSNTIFFLFFFPSVYYKGIGLSDTLSLFCKKSLRCEVFCHSVLGTKLEQAKKFNDPDDPCKILVATDAIGMGLNL